MPGHVMVIVREPSTMSWSLVGDGYDNIIVYHYDHNVMVCVPLVIIIIQCPRVAQTIQCCVLVVVIVPLKK